MAMAACCVPCLLEKQRLACGDEEYLAEVRHIVENRRDCDSPPYLVYLFQQAYERRFGKGSPYGAVKKQYNNLVLAMEHAIRGQGRHIFYSFLCKCELFTRKFQVPKFSGVFAEEWK